MFFVYALVGNVWIKHTILHVTRIELGPKGVQ